MLETELLKSEKARAPAQDLMNNYKGMMQSDIDGLKNKVTMMQSEIEDLRNKVTSIVASLD